MKNRLSTTNDMGRTIAHSGGSNSSTTTIRNILMILAVLILSIETIDMKQVTVAVIHWNDLESKFQPTDISGPEPLPCHIEAETVNATTALPPSTEISQDSSSCTGGFPTLVSLLSQLTPGIPPQNHLRLTPGNFITAEDGLLSVLKYSLKGTSSQFKPLADIFNFVKITAWTPGPKDILYGFHTALNSSSCHVSNLELNKNHTGIDLHLPKTHSIIHVKDERLLDYPIGILGFVDPIIQDSLPPDDHHYAPVIPWLKTTVEAGIKEHKQEKYFKPLKVFIAVGNCNLTLCKAILEEIPEVKVIVTGVGSGIHAKDYPLKHKQGLIVSADAYGSSIGNLTITFNSDSGEIISFNGILVENHPNVITPDNATLNATLKMERIIHESSQESIGVSEFPLSSGQICQKQGCHLGNIVTDSMSRCVSSDIHFRDNGHEGGEHILQQFEFIRGRAIYAIWFSDYINRLEFELKSYHEIREIDIHKVLPYMKTGHLTKINGSELVEVFKAVEKSGRFLQISSNMRANYTSLKNPSLKSLEILSESGFEGVDPGKEYLVVIPEEIILRFGSFRDLKEDFMESVLITVNITCVINYIKRMELLSGSYNSRSFPDEGVGFCNSAIITAVVILILLETVGIVYLLRDIWMRCIPGYRQKQLFNHERLVATYSKDNQGDYQEENANVKSKQFSVDDDEFNIWN